MTDTRTPASHLLHLAWPLFIALIMQMLMGVADTIMAGQYSADDMAAIAVGVSLINPLQFFLQGVALALVPLVGNAVGSGQPHKIPIYVRHMLLVVLTLSVLGAGLHWCLPNILGWFSVPGNMYPMTYEYAQWMLWGLPGFALYQVVRQTCEGLGITKPTMLIMIIGLCLNIPLNAVFVYGLGPIPAFGGPGCGIASFIVYWLMAMMTIAYTKYAQFMKPYDIWQLGQINLSQLALVLKLGLPISFTLLAEVTLFAAVALLVAPLGTVQVAAHQIAINFSSLVFMLPLSIGMATAIRLGHLHGENNSVQCRQTFFSAVKLTTSMSLITAALTVLTASTIVQIYTSDSSIWPLATQVLFLGALFQISDAIQVVSGNALRGYKDTKWLFGISFISYWVIGLPLGYCLSLTDLLYPTMGVRGFWIAIIIGLTFAAVAYSARIRYFHTHYLHV